MCNIVIFNIYQITIPHNSPFCDLKCVTPTGLCHIKILIFIPVLSPSSDKTAPPWSGVIPEKLTLLQIVKKFSTFYGTRKFIRIGQVKIIALHKLRFDQSFIFYATQFWTWPLLIKSYINSSNINKCCVILLATETQWKQNLVPVTATLLNTVYT